MLGTARSTARAGIGSAVVLVSLAVIGIPAPATARVTPAAPADVVDVPGIDPVLDGVVVRETAPVRRAERRYADAQRAEGEATDRFVAADRAHIDLIRRSAAAGSAVAEAERAVAAATAELRRQVTALDTRRAATARARRALTLEQDTLRSVVSTVFTSRPSDALPVIGSFEQMTVGQRRQDVRDRTVDIQSRIVDEHDRAWRAAGTAEAAQRRRVRRAQDRRAARRADRRQAIAVRDDLGRLRAEAERTTAARRADLTAAGTRRRRALLARRRARLTAPLPGLDLTLVDLHAYWLGSANAPCSLSWWALAGIGRVETHHGTAHGSEVDASGTTSVRILGIPLDGRPGVAAIPDTDGGLLDADAIWDRAVGPMQFIPTTWGRWARDGNADERSDPHNLYDAAAAAADYLCFGRADLVTDPALRGALLSYNRSVAYGTAVLAGGHRYRDAIDLPEVPTPRTTSPGATTAGG